VDDDGKPITVPENAAAPAGDPKTITVPEAAEEVGISAWSYYQAVKRGELPALRVGRRLVVPVAKLRALLDA
jgi:excisionase family DNA binding protein